MEKIVTGCSNCPFLQVDGEYGTCDCIHPVAKQRPNVITPWVAENDPSGEVNYHHSPGYRLPFDDDEEPITPDWCPLNEEPITICKR